MKLGSLFDGSGGFPFAGLISGITPIWASEIEPYPLRVTAARFPHMKQLGDVTKINGAEIEPVDVITFGSPCQDLSVAGKQAGIRDGERSNLFFEAIRIIREMRGATNGKYPRFAVWENVPGAFSSNKGADFRAVLQALTEIADPNVLIPEPPRGGWTRAGCIVGKGFSIAWRTYDAQFFGVPQRRKRIYLIADFGSERAGEILFERESMRGYPETSREAREGAAADAEGSASGDGHSVCFGIGSYHSNAMRSDNPYSGFYEAKTSRTLDLNGGNPTCNQGGLAIVQSYQKVVGRSAWMTTRGQTGSTSAKIRWLSMTAAAMVRGGVSPTLTGDHENRVTDYTSVAVYDTTQITCPNNYSNPRPGDPCHPLAAQQHAPLAVCAGNGQLNQISMQPQSNTLDCMHDQQIVLKKNDKPPRKYIVRRLTPLECCRLQGFPDWWEDGVEGSDSARYKMWGNGIALPCAVDVLGRIAKHMRKE